MEAGSESFGNAIESNSLQQAKEMKPDLIFLTPLTGLWSFWVAHSPAADLKSKATYYPIWCLLYKLWELQNEQGRLVLPDEM